MRQELDLFELEYTVNPVQIGSQIWMDKNLNIDCFRNGEQIFEAKTEADWIDACENNLPAFCYLDFDPKNGSKFGKLYNGFAIRSWKNLAPEGWVIPSLKQFKELHEFLGGSEDYLTDDAGIKLKSSTGWDGTDDFNFNALKCGTLHCNHSYNTRYQQAHLESNIKLDSVNFSYGVTTFWSSTLNEQFEQKQSIWDRIRQEYFNEQKAIFPRSLHTKTLSDNKTTFRTWLDFSFEGHSVRCIADK